MTRDNFAVAIESVYYVKFVNFVFEISIKRNLVLLFCLNNLIGYIFLKRVILFSGSSNTKMHSAVSFTIKYIYLVLKCVVFFFK